jgi:hypothetical protein
MDRPRRILRHLRHGTLLEAVRRRLGGARDVAEDVRWHGAASVPQAVHALLLRAGAFVSGRAGHVLVVGDGGPLQAALERAMRGAGVAHRSAPLDALPGDATGVAGVVGALPDERRTFALARALAAHPALREVPFDFASGLDPSRGAFARHDERRGDDFVSPVLLDSPTPHQIYEASLALFEKKCALRDWLDLYQVLREVLEREVPGDVAEFGSYRGHSGWLLARALEALGSDKALWLFDTFGGFPVESRGIDRFWNDTHDLRFDEVRAKFRGIPRVRFVQGDFTRTLAGSGLGPVALAHVDCDSYRGTRFVLDALWEGGLLAARGASVCEDYGHPPLLGSRLACHEVLDGRRDAVRFFSAFSGVYVAVRA